MSQLTESMLTILMAIVGVAILAALISRKSNTVAVIQAASGGFSNALGMALSPVTGAGYSLNTGAPSGGLGQLPSLPSLGGGYGG